MLTAQTGDGDDSPADPRDYPIFNVSTLAVHDADAFVPHLFTAPGKQPVTPRAAWHRLDIPEGGFLPVKFTSPSAGLQRARHRSCRTGSAISTTSI